MDGQIAGENIFFTIAELRLHVTQMITAYENDPTASQLLAAGYDALVQAPLDQFHTRGMAATVPGLIVMTGFP